MDPPVAFQLQKPDMIPMRFIRGATAIGFITAVGLLAQTEPPHPILTISGSGSGASTILSSWTETQYTNNFTPRLGPRNDSYGFVPAVVSGDTDWSWSSSSPNQITSEPSGTVFPNATYTVLTQAVTVMNGNTVNAPYYLRAGSASAKSLVFNLIAYQQRAKLRSDFNALAPAYINSGSSPTTRNDTYARRIGVALLDWARYFPNYTVTAKNSASFINTGPSYILGSDLQRASDHNGLAHEWADDELLAFDAIYDSVALTNLSAQMGFDVRGYIKTNLFYDEGDFIVYHVPPEVATDSNLSGPFSVLALVARVLNRPDYILWMDDYLGITVREKIHRDGALSEGMGYSIGYINENQNGAENTRDYFKTRPANTTELLSISNRANSYVATLTYGQQQWGRIALPNGQLPSFGDTPFNNYFTARNTGLSALLPSYGTVSMGAGASSSTAVQLNQNFSGDNNHMRSDTTAYTLWAFGNEYLGNIRYHNGTPGRNFTEQILAYNAVTIDRTDMSSPSANTYGNGDLTLYEAGNNGLAMTEIDGQRAYANKASRYQRIMLLNTFDLAKPYVVDVLRVTGGTTHDYVFHGSIRYDQTYECSFPLVTNTAAYPMLEGSEVWVEPTTSGSTFPYYGFWRNVSSNQAPGNFQITYRDTSASNRDTRLWMLDDGTAKVHIGRTPVPLRVNGEPADYWVNNLWRPSLIIRKRVTSGTLSNLFVSVIEPMNNGVSMIQNVERLPMNGSSLESVALRITFTDGRVDNCVVNLRNPQVTGANTGTATVSTTNAQYSLAGRIGVHSVGPAGSRVWLVNGSQFQYPGGVFAPTNLYSSGLLVGETRKLTGGANDAFITTTPLPLGTALRGKPLSVTFGALSGSGTTNISEMFEIDQVMLTNGQYHICFATDHNLEITNGTTSVEQMGPLRKFTGSNQFEIALSASQTTTVPGAPTGLVAIPGNTQVLLSWNASGAATYNVKRSTTNGGPYSTITNTAANTVTDTGLVNGTSYFYVVSGLNQIGESPASLQASATPSAFAPTGMVARLTFDDGTASDSSGFGNHGTLLNGASIITDAQRGKVLSLDGVDAYVNLGNGASLNVSDNNQVTVAAWVKVAASQNHNTILSKGEWKEAYALVVKGDTAPKDQLWTGNDTSVFSTNGIPLNTWTHVAMTINGDLTTFYLNGQLSGSTNQDRGNALDNTATGVAIGREQYAGSLPAGRWFFNGQLDDLRIYERSLTRAELQSVMVNSANAAPSFTSALISKPPAAAGQSYVSSIAGNAIDPDPGDALTYSKVSGPVWLTVAASGGLSGTPGSSDVGTNTFGVRVTDLGSLFDEATLTLAVTPAPPVIAAISLEGDGLVLNWTGGIPPYQVQLKTNLLEVGWQDCGGLLDTNRFMITPTNTAEFYRVESQ
jgi:Concanavalin A-like lectin/glucanases superfamily/Putative Ig domain